MSKSRRISVNIDDYPRCASCEMPVESFYAVEGDKSISLVVECHRDIETVILDGRTLEGLDFTTIGIKMAFSKRNEE